RRHRRPSGRLPRRRSLRDRILALRRLHPDPGPARRPAAGTAMSAVRLDLIRESLEGTIPGIMATCSADGTPNVAYLSQTEYVDERHIALSYQFFNTTRRNVLENPHARLIVTHPQSAERHRLLIRYLRT